MGIWTLVCPNILVTLSIETPLAMAQGCGNQALIEELATLNRKIRLTIKPVGGHEGRTNDGNQTCQRRYVPSMEIAAPSNGLKNILSLPQRAAFQERTKVWLVPGINPTCWPYLCL